MCGTTVMRFKIKLMRSEILHAKAGKIRFDINTSHLYVSVDRLFLGDFGGAAAMARD